MKLEKIKHDHSLTDILKVLIFSILMLAPIFASISQMLYVVFNKNAHESYYGETINERKNLYISNYNELKNNVIYYTNTITSVSDIDSNYGGSNIGINIENLKKDNVLDSSIKKITFYHDANREYHDIAFRDANNNIVYNYLTTNTILNTISFEFVSIATTESNLTTLNTFLNDLLIHTIEYNKYSYLDNAFYYGVDEMTQSDLFNWTQNTALYTGVKAMTDNLEIQTPVIAVLIVYWFILTIIYIIIDITLKLFTYLTHGIFHKS